MMTLKSIELASFKSFGKKSAISFTTPITAVVGPNGSGKSNIVEAIRFVLGEQSMKSLRGKGGVDLIFKGSKSLASANRAKVSIVFDNTKKIFEFTNSGLGVSLDYDEVTLAREVFADGGNTYSINGTEVRLKDIIDLLSSVNIGSSGHHIISQGEADRVLNASSKDRRGMIEDALGLKIYQYRIKESERKLEKTQINMKEVSALRREIAPHLSFLKKQVEKVEKAREMQEDLRNLYKDFFSRESSYIHIETKRLTHAKHILDEQLLSFDERIEKIQLEKKEENTESKYGVEIKNTENELSALRVGKDDLARKLGRVEGIFEGLEKQLSKPTEHKEKVITEFEWKILIQDLESHINQALESVDMPSMIEILKSMKSRIVALHNSSASSVPIINENIKKEYDEIIIIKDNLNSEMEKILSKEKNINSLISELKQKEQESQVSLRDNERILYELLQKKNEAVSESHMMRFEEEKLAQIKNAFEIELQEAEVLIGKEVLSYTQATDHGEPINRTTQDELRKKIERIKIKLEDAGVGGSGEILKEYEDTRDRDVFLAKELEDLNKSIESLRVLIQDLKQKLDVEFKHGVEKINKQFQEFFALMFGGGSAFLSVTMEHKRLKKSDELDESTDDENLSEEKESNELGFERGIEINVTLPQKKVKDLHMLSGGERSLTSIALLFAISQVNPPPFLVLDETDAALDESNSRKYGSMLENLSKYSQLIVVTHNRETMSRAQVLYGVTMDSLGASKLLSIRLEDASTYAK